MVVGILFPAAMQWLARGEPEQGFVFESFAVLGATVGARITWESVGAGVPDHHDEARFLAAVGLPVFAREYVRGRSA